MNAPNRYELYVLEEGETPVEVTEDTKIPNAATIKILKQDHTLGNMLRAQLLSMPQILFAGYKVPHPLHPYFLLKIQTDGSITPEAILSKASNDLIGTLESLREKFEREFSFKDVDGTASSAGAFGAGFGGQGAGVGVGSGAGAGGAPGGAYDDPYGTGATGGTAGWGNRDDYLDF